MSNMSLLSEEIHSAIIEEELLAEGILQDIIGGIASFIKKLFSQENLDKAKQLGKQGMEWTKERIEKEVVPKLKELIRYTVDQALPTLARGALQSLIEAMADKKTPFTEKNIQIVLRDHIKALIAKAQTAVAVGSVVAGGGIGKLLLHTVAGKTAGKSSTLTNLYNMLVMQAVEQKVYPYIIEEIMTFEQMEAVYGGDPDDVYLGGPLEPQDQELNEAKVYQRWQKIAGIIKG